MRGKILFSSVILVLVLGLALVGYAEMTSTNYKIPTTVMSGGGVPMTSTSYKANGTMGQPSPLMDPGVPPGSTSYDLYPGFWYTLQGGDLCEGDFDNNNIVDSADLTVFAADFGRTDCDTGDPCEGNFDSDNDVDSSDLTTFAEDFGRTDCP